MKIALCGSSKAYKKLFEVAGKLKDRGHECYPPDLQADTVAEAVAKVEYGGKVDRKLEEKLKREAEETLCELMDDKGYTDEHEFAEEYIEKYGKERGLEILREVKPRATERHFEHIANSDAILIVNPDRGKIRGYFGPNTLMELAVAFYLERAIYLLCPFDKCHPYYEEIDKLDAAILREDLGKILLKS